jgi:hypothetical protein
VLKPGDTGEVALDLGGGRAVEAVAMR